MMIMDEKRVQAYDGIADELKELVSNLNSNEQYWIGLAGNPGSGKSTLAEALKVRLRSWLTVIPMDGYHYYQRELNKMNDPVEAHARRGAPFTFNATKFVDALIKARKKGHGSFPSFDHANGDPVEDAIKLKIGRQLVLVEGNYLLLDEEPWSQLREKVFDETWYLDVTIHECSRRVFERHVQTGLSEQQAQVRIDSNDRRNAERITESSPKNADRIIRISY